METWLRQARRMSKVSYAGHRFPSSVMQHTAWLYQRISLSLRDFEDLLAERRHRCVTTTNPIRHVGRRSQM